MKNKSLGVCDIPRDEEGRAIINMNVSDDSGFLSPFSTTEAPVISSDVADFIEKSTKHTLPDEKYTLRIKGKSIDSSERSLYETAIRSYYREEAASKKAEIKHNRTISLMVLIVGIIVLSVAFIIDYNIAKPIWSEVVDIVAWVLIWEAVYLELFENRKEKIKIRYYTAYTDMKIEFV